MWSPFCNPFVFTFMHVMGVCTPLLNVRTFKSANRSSTAVVERRSRSGRDVSTCFRSIPFVFISLRTLLRFFARCKNLSLFISSVSALFAKNTGGGGTPPLSKRNKMKLRTANSAFYPFVAPIALPVVVRQFRLGWWKGRNERAKKSGDGLQGSNGM